MHSAKSMDMFLWVKFQYPKMNTTRMGFWFEKILK